MCVFTGQFCAICFSSEPKIQRPTVFSICTSTIHTVIQLACIEVVAPLQEQILVQDQMCGLNIFLMQSVSAHLQLVSHVNVGYIFGLASITSR